MHVDAAAQTVGGAYGEAVAAVLEGQGVAEGAVDDRGRLARNPDGGADVVADCAGDDHLIAVQIGVIRRFGDGEGGWLEIDAEGVLGGRDVRVAVGDRDVDPVEAGGELALLAPGGPVVDRAAGGDVGAVEENAHARQVDAGLLIEVADLHQRWPHADP
jgi:hypothetical protein